MCTGMEIAAIVGATASAYSATQAGKGGGGPIGPDPAAERAKAEAEATQRANAKISMQRKAMRDNSLLTGAGLGGPAPAVAPKTLGV